MINEKMAGQTVLNIIKTNAKHKPIYIWGAYSHGLSLEHFLSQNNISITGFLDSNPSKQNTMLETYSVNNPDILKETDAFVLVALEEYSSVRALLAECEYLEYRDYLYCGSMTILTETYNYQDVFGNEISGKIKDIVVQIDFLNTIKIGKNVKFGKNTKIIMSSCSELVIEDNVRFGDDTVIKVAASSSLMIGSNSFFEKNLDIFVNDNSSVVINEAAFQDHTRITCALNAEIIIKEKSTFRAYLLLLILDNTRFHCGKDCMFSYEISVRSENGHTLLKNGLPAVGRKDVILADHVWVGQRALLFSGTRIGTGSVVGAASFVNKSFGDHVTIAGSPAKVLTEHIDWER